MKTTNIHQNILELIKQQNEIPKELLYSYENQNIFKFQWITEETQNLLLEKIDEINAKKRITIIGKHIKRDSSFEKIVNFYQTLLPIIELKYPLQQNEEYELKEVYFIGYQENDIIEHPGHCDDSDVTINLCLGKKFEGGNLLFGLQRNLVYKLSCIQFPGTIFIHEGFKTHGASPVTKGERYNLIYLLKKRKISKKTNKNSTHFSEDFWFNIICFLEVNDILKLCLLNHEMVEKIKSRNFFWSYLLKRDFCEEFELENMEENKCINYQKYRELTLVIKYYPIEMRKKLDFAKTIPERINLKIVILGDEGVGKSAFVIQFIQGNFVPSYDPTIEDSYRKRVQIDENLSLLEILDTVNSNKYLDITDQYFKNADSFLVMFSIIDEISFSHLRDYLKKIRDVKEEDFPIVIVGNKLDLPNERQVSKSDALKLTRSFNAHYLEGSGKDRINCEEAFHDLARLNLN
eukprot:gene11875-5202_t